MTKEVGGRGKRSENKYQTTSISLHPATMKTLRDYAAHNKLSVSEMVSSMVHHYSRFRPLRERKEPLLKVSRETSNNGLGGAEAAISAVRAEQPTPRPSRRKKKVSEV